MLNEILWEFTLKCNKNCKYCGSKNNLNKEEDIYRIHIAKEISYMKPREVTFTGGEPSLLLDELSKCADILNKKEIKCKVLTNGNLFKQKLDDEFDKKFECYGYSVNELNDIENAMTNLLNIPRDKTTIITNFGLHNIDHFDKIAKFAVLFPCWQIQLTMGNEFQLDIDDIEKLLQKIQDLPKNFIQVIRADNLNCNKCSAGISSCSITWNGDVIPCLSYRAWKNDLMIQGNLFNTSLKKIWKNKFNFFRERKFVPCCKNISGIKEILQKEDAMFNPTYTDVIAVYGVKIPTDIQLDLTPIVYGVANTGDYISIK